MCAPNCSDSMNSSLFLQYDLHDSGEETLTCVSSKIHRLQQYKRILSCVLHPVPQVSLYFLHIAAGIGTSNILRRFFMISLNSSSSGSTKK